MHDVIILTENEAIGACQPQLAVAAPLASFCVRNVTYACINTKRGVYLFVQAYVPKHPGVDFTKS